MVGTRAYILDGPIGEIIEQQVRAIEDAITQVPDFAFDLAKALIESVCKTILEDLGRPAGEGSNLPTILKETLNSLSMVPPGHAQGAEARESIKNVINGLKTAVQGICELRTTYGLSSHGRDAFSARLGLRHAILAAQAADTIVSFLYRIHRDALMQTPGVRVYYEDHADFNDAFDRDNETIQVCDLGLVPSRVVFLADPVGYKDALNLYVAERDGTGDEPSDDTSGDATQEAQ